MATTHLGTWGAPSRLVFKTGFTRDPALSAPGRTQLRVYGAPGPTNVFTSRAPSIVVPIVSFDTVSVQWLEDPVDSNQILTQDTVRISLVELSQLFNQIITGDNATVTLSETVALVQQGVLALTASDTVAVALTEVLGTSIAIATADAVSVSFGEASTLTTPTVIVSTSDTVSVSLTDTSVLGIFTGVLQFFSQDDLNVSFDEVSDLVQITPSKPALIRIQPLTARIQIVAL
jgi:hypothetical protein